jgi:hypothetical protein
VHEAERLAKIAGAQRMHVSVSALAGYAIRLFLDRTRDDEQLELDLHAGARGGQ